MVKCKTRRRRNALHEFCLEQEAAALAKKEAKRLKNEERRKAEQSAAGADGQVAALDGVRYGGKFGVSFADTPAATAAGGKDDDRMDTEDDADKKKMTKQLACELGRKHHLIKKAKKMQKAKVVCALPLVALRLPARRPPASTRPVGRLCAGRPAPSTLLVGGFCSGQRRASQCGWPPPSRASAPSSDALVCA